MIQEIIIFSMGFLFANFIKCLKIMHIAKILSKALEKDMAEAEKMQKEFSENGGSQELADRQAKSVSVLGKHVGRKEMLKYFNYILW